MGVNRRIANSRGCDVKKCTTFVVWPPVILCMLPASRLQCLRDVLFGLLYQEHPRGDCQQLCQLDCHCSLKAVLIFVPFMLLSTEG